MSIFAWRIAEYRTDVKIVKIVALPLGRTVCVNKWLPKAMSVWQFSAKNNH